MKTIHDIDDVSTRRELKIEQVPHEGVTIIEGTRYANALLILLGQNGVGSGPFVICSRQNGEVTMRTITEWPERPEPVRTQSGLDKLRSVNDALAEHSGQ